MKAADADEIGIIKFVDLIELLVKHRLYISDSGFIAKYGKTKSSERKNIKATKRCSGQAANFLSSHITSIGWGVTYLFVNILLMLIGVLSTSNNGWGQWAYGTGPALSFNLVLVIVPMMKSLVQNMRGSPWLNKVRERIREGEEINVSFLGASIKSQSVFSSLYHFRHIWFNSDTHNHSSLLICFRRSRGKLDTSRQFY